MLIFSAITHQKHVAPRRPCAERTTAPRLPQFAPSHQASGLAYASRRRPYRPARPCERDQQLTHTHTLKENNTPDTDTHAHDKNNTPNLQTNTFHKHLTMLEKRRVKGALQLRSNRHLLIRFAHVHERVLLLRFVKLLTAITSDLPMKPRNNRNTRLTSRN